MADAAIHWFSQDLGSYQVKKVFPLELEHHVPGNGGLLGDMFMKSAFNAMAKERLSCYKRCKNIRLIEEDAWQHTLEGAWRNTSRSSGDIMDSPNWFLRLPIRRRNGAQLPDLMIPG